MGFKDFFSEHYLFTNPVGAMALSDRVYLYVGLALIFLGIACALFAYGKKDRLQRAMLMRFRSWAMTIGLLGAIWAGLRYELVRFFSWHFWILLIYLIGLIWGIYLLKYMLFNYRRAKAEQREEALKNKYI